MALDPTSYAATAAMPRKRKPEASHDDEGHPENPPTKAKPEVPPLPATSNQKESRLIHHNLS